MTRLRPAGSWPQWALKSLSLVAVLALFACSGGGGPDFDGDGSPDAEDCDPADSAVHPGAADPYGNGIDENCDGVDGFDGDGDGYAAQDDCNDGDATINPGAEEIEANGIDEDCDGFDLGGDDDDATGDDDDDTTPPNIEGDEPGECSDGADNDADTLYDCDDPDCAGAPDCEEALNTPPTAPVVSIVPASPHSTMALNCLVETASEDVDGHLVTYSWAWTVNGADAGISDVVAPASATSTGDDWVCAVTPNDGFVDGPEGTATVTVTNLPPSQPSVLITPPVPTSTDDLLCVIETPSVDPEGQGVSYAFSWSVGGVPTGSTSTSVVAADTLGNEVWTCTVTPNDGGDDGPSASAGVTVTIPLGCSDGSVEKGSSTWGRDDIVMCALATAETTPPTPAAGLALCGDGWRICTAADLTARNDSYGGGSMQATIDDGSDCAALQHPSSITTVLAYSDLIWDNFVGSCTGAVGSETTQDVGRGARSVNDSSRCVLDPCGVLCCYD